MSAAATATKTAAQPSKILLVDDHLLLLEALAFVLRPNYEVSCIGSLRQLDFAFAAFRPDALVIDISMPDGDGVSTGYRLLRRHPNLKLIFLSMHTEARLIRRALDSGAHGFVSKKSPATDLVNAVETVLQGGRYKPDAVPVSPHDNASDPSLTGRQVQVLRLVARGFSAKEIATDLDISVRTAEFHRGAIMHRLGIHSTALLTRYAMEAGLL